MCMCYGMIEKWGTLETSGTLAPPGTLVPLGPKELKTREKPLLPFKLEDLYTLKI